MLFYFQLSEIIKQFNHKSHLRKYFSLFLEFMIVLHRFDQSTKK